MKSIGLHFEAFRHDMLLYTKLISMQVRAQFQYKVNLILDILSYFLISSLEFTALLLYFQAFPNLLGWSVGEVGLITGTMSITFGISEAVGSGIDDFSQIIRKGEFDRVLLRPLNTLVQIFGSDFRFRRFGRITQGILVMVISLSLLPDFHWDLLKVVVWLMGIASGACIFLGILILGATICFWTVETTELTNILTYGAREMLSYPLTIYNVALQKIFLFVVPVAFGVYVPVCFLLNRDLPFDLPRQITYFCPLIAIFFVMICVMLWNLGVKHYKSTGS